ncbi:carbon storage regulator CsrA [bacterium]|nr:carbon storage regulator CsrA [bacterium]
MLILSRKNGQKIIINDEIEITILESKNDNCKIAVKAPKDVKIYREEVYQQIQDANKQSDNVSLEVLGNLSDLVPPSNAQKKVVIKKKQNDNNGL